MQIGPVLADTLVRFLFVILGTIWGGVFIYRVSIDVPVFSFLGLVPLFVLVAAGVGVCTGGSRVTAMAGKVLMLGSGVAIAMEFISRFDVAIYLLDWMLVFAFVTGLLMERVSPHQRFYTWMFLAVATKIELVLVAGVVMRMPPLDVPLPLVPLAWWVVVGLMASGVPLLIFRIQLLYGWLVLVTTVWALGLFAAYIWLGVPERWEEVVLLSAATVWPLVADRLIGRRVFTRAE